MERVFGTSRVVQTLRQIPADTERELEGELDSLAAIVQRRMRQKVGKFRSHLVNSIQVAKPEPLVREIGTSMDYGLFQEEGVRPGGKGLPRFEDPEAADIKAWLQGHAFSGKPSARRGSAAAVARELELRDRYEGLALHIRRRGVKARPFAEPAFNELAPVIEVRLQAAAERALQASAGSAA